MKKAQLPPGRMAHIRRTTALYNMVPNLTWTILHLAPVTVFCFTWMRPLWVYVLLVAALLVALLPAIVYRKMQLGAEVAVYKRIGIMWVRRFSQDGDIINRLLRKRFPGYKVIHEPAGVRRYILRANMNERFHCGLFAFMTGIMVFAVVQAHYIWALVIAINNVLYNLYPMFLQQYNRIRLREISHHREGFDMFMRKERIGLY
ncbi:hypothetical protein MKQ70_16865 [Chitinophaga sedimenti]|uniref:glycosyl-4,4'-diaponeurosporenoate acyltransferase CrtO family protein n=1 Tax=Chitinophaga sedimenti TaxID=2033606 RepID=UPI0020052159|nr:hypothetical protein [Chitinophaga sedimenti]MCK7556599.1 hypothetical protein [Chitinophaga sedimenti]